MSWKDTVIAEAIFKINYLEEYATQLARIMEIDQISPNCHNNRLSLPSKSVNEVQPYDSSNYACLSPFKWSNIGIFLNIEKIGLER